MRVHRAVAIVALAAALVACGTPAPSTRSPGETRALIAQLIPPTVPDREGWAVDIAAAFGALGIAPSAVNLCAVLAVTEQESTYVADPRVPGLAAIARREIEQRAERAGVPTIAVDAALAIRSPDGRSYRERLDAVRTERELSEIYEDFIGMVPLGRRFLASRNPVRTGGPMQVAIAFAEQHAAERRYPYQVRGTIRHEVFTRRGGLYFGIAHLLGYEAPYDEPLYRFADFNAGRWASRNAALQNAIAIASGVRLVLDGDLLPPGDAGDRPAGATERAALSIAERLEMSPAAIRRDLARGDEPGLEETTLARRVYALADRAGAGRPVPRALIPRIQLQSPKIRRQLTTEWFARRVDERHARCLAREAALRNG